jgi:hypothetical protein
MTMIEENLNLDSQPHGLPDCKTTVLTPFCNVRWQDVASEQSIIIQLI